MSKLIRDKYVEVIEPGRLVKPESEQLKFNLLEEKIQEELAEVIDSDYRDPAEFGDLIEVLYAMAKFQGISLEDIEQVRKEKLDKFGGFENFLMLVENGK